MSKLKIGDKVRIKTDCNNTGESNDTIWTICRIDNNHSPVYDIKCTTPNGIKTWGVDYEDMLPVTEQIEEFKWEYGVKYKTSGNKWAIYLGDMRELENSDSIFCLIFLHMDNRICTHTVNGRDSLVNPPSSYDVTTTKYKELIPTFTKEVWIDLTEGSNNWHPQYLSDLLFEKNLSSTPSSKYKKPGYQKFKITVEEIEDNE